MDPLYTITSVEPTMQSVAGAMPAAAYRVQFRTATGQTGVIVVMAGADFADRMHQAVDAEAKQLVDAVTRPALSTYTGS